MNLLEDWLGKSVAPAKEIFVDKPTTEIERSQTTEFSNELPGGMYQITFEYNTSADATVEKNSQQLESYTRTWRLISNYPEVGEAIDEIVNESVINDSEDVSVKLDLSGIDKKDLADTIKKEIEEEFDNILDLLSFNQKGQDYFETWYIDGRLDLEVVVSRKNTKDGILKINRLDPLNIKKILEQKDRQEFKIKEKETYWIYTDPQKQLRWKVSPDLVVHIGSARTDRVTGLEVSYLHKALKAINNLRLIEDAIVIYRIVRAPEKRVFSIDTGNLSKPKAEEYIKSLIHKFQNRIVYDSATGQVTNTKNTMAMIEDFYVGKSTNGQGSSISTLAGGSNLGELDDLYYFVLKVYKALKVPESRRETKEKALFDSGRSTQIERDEVKFMKFINKLRKQFSTLFTELLYRQLLFKGKLTKETLDKIKKKFRYIYTNDNYYEEIKESEMLNNRLDLASKMRDFVGVYYTDDDIAIKILKYTEEEWKKKKEECKKVREEKAKEEAALNPDLGNEGAGGSSGGSGQFPPKKEDSVPPKKKEPQPKDEEV
jgi:hypothetical protein